MSSCPACNKNISFLSQFNLFENITPEKVYTCPHCKEKLTIRNFYHWGFGYITFFLVGICCFMLLDFFVFEPNFHLSTLLGKLNFLLGIPSFLLAAFCFISAAWHYLVKFQKA